MAKIDVDTLTENCWKICPDLEIYVDNYHDSNTIYHQFIYCKHVERCRHIKGTLEEETKNGR